MNQKKLLENLTKKVIFLTNLSIGLGIFSLIFLLIFALENTSKKPSESKKELTEKQKDSLKIALKKALKSPKFWLPPSENTLRNDEKSKQSIKKNNN